MTGFATDGILRVVTRIANTAGVGRVDCGCAASRRGSAVRARLLGHPLWFVLTVVVTAIAAISPAHCQTAVEATDFSEELPVTAAVTELESFGWNFGRADDVNFDGRPDGWKRYEGIGYPKYVKSTIAARDPEFEKKMLAVDADLVRMWRDLRPMFPSLSSLPPSISDATVNRFLKIELDGGQFMAQSPTIPASRLYQYRFSSEIMTDRLRHDRVRAELVFLDDTDVELVSHSSPSIRGTTSWTHTHVDLVRPPLGATKMMVRLIIVGSDDGLEDIRGTIGFDNLRIEQYPQLQVTTDDHRGVYSVGKSVTTTAKIMGLPTGASKIKFTLLDHDQRVLATRLMSVKHRHDTAESTTTIANRGPSLNDSEVSWTMPLLEPGFYRVAASIIGKRASTLSTEVTFVVVDDLIGNTPHGPFGWTLPRGAGSIPPRELAPWLSNLGVAWVKYPCWISPDDTRAAEETAVLLAKLQDHGIQTVGMLGVPPEEQIAKYELRGRRDLVAAQLFRDIGTWQPQLEPVMARLTLKVRTWQLGVDRDHSFLGRPRLRDSISQIATGLQGFGQPIEVAISWPWLEEELGPNETSWQAICRSSDPPLAAHELDAFLSLNETTLRSDGPRTWLLLDPIDKNKYDRDSRIRDLVLRMATVRSHRVQAAFMSDPHHEQHGLLRPGGRPDELLLPWRTTSRLIGNLRKTGSLQLQCNADNSVFMGDGRAVLMLWSAEPTVEKIYLGDNVQMIDVWGKTTDLPVHPDDIQPGQHVPIGPVPIFIVGADPSLLAFRMSVELEPSQLDSLLGEIQPLHVKFSNPSRDSLVGTIRMLTPQSWSIDSPLRNWESLGGRSITESFDVVLSNTAKIGSYDVPIQFEIETIPPKLITVHRNISVGPDGLDLKITTRLLAGNELRVKIEVTNRSSLTQAYDCLLFPPPGRQYQRRFITIPPGESVRREIFWQDGSDLVGKTMLLRAVEQDGNRVLNYSIDVKR